MNTTRKKLLTGTVLPVLAGAGVAIGGVLIEPPAAEGAVLSHLSAVALPGAKPKPAGIRLAACAPCNPCNPCGASNPCAGKNPCNPCAAKNPCAAANPCSPCAAANPCNPCNPCAAGSGAVSQKCVVPRLAAAKARPCNPCAPAAAKNPCNPCAATNPCAAKNPCAAANPCNPCNPCAPGQAVQLTREEARAAYDCLKPEMAAAYAKAGVEQVKGYMRWANVAAVPYVSATHGSRYVNNYANAIGAPFYSKFEKVGRMPAGSVLAKDSFVVNADGTLAVGPLFVMAKKAKGFNAETHDWQYQMIMPDGSLFGTTGGVGSAKVQFCAECHATMEDQDSLFFLPEEYRVKR